MLKYNRFYLILILSFSKNIFASGPNIVSFFEWKKTCFSLPENTKNYKKAAISQDKFLSSLKEFAKISSYNICKDSIWYENQSLPEEFFNIRKPSKFYPFAQKLIINPRSEVAFWGDLHGSIHSFLRTLQMLIDRGYINDNFQIKKDNFYMIFLGDYVDRGFYGVEVIYTLLQLKIANPDKVFLVRGNHEDGSLNDNYGFGFELDYKFNLDKKLVYRIYDFLPVVLYLGSGKDIKVDFIQCCHGGMEIGYNPYQFLNSDLEFQLIDSLYRKDNLNLMSLDLINAIYKNIPIKELVNFYPLSPTKPYTLGFMWNDFVVGSSEIINYKSGRGWIFGESLTRYLLKKNSSNSKVLRGIFRAHQHHGLMLDNLIKNKGVYSLWDGIVHTFLSASSIAGFNFDSFGILKTSENYDDWKLEHITNKII